MNKIIGLDVGIKTLGIAEAKLKTIVMPVTTVHYSKGNYYALHDKLSKAIDLEKVETIVIGNPLHIDGKESKMSIYVKKVSSYLGKKYPNIKIVLFDEHNSTKDALKFLSANKSNNTNNISDKDNVAACFILQSFLDRFKN